jgi:hypothetical protein
VEAVGYTLVFVRQLHRCTVLRLWHSACHLLLGPFGKLRKATFSFVMSVYPPIPLSTWNNSAPTGRILKKFHIWIIFENLSRIFKCHSSRGRITDTLHEDQYTFSIISRSVLLGIKNVSDKSCRENKNTHFMFSHRWQYGACALYAGYLRLKTHTQNI